MVKIQYTQQQIHKKIESAKCKLKHFNKAIIVTERYY